MQYPPDGLVKSVRFGCGAGLGLLIGLVFFIRMLPEDGALIALLIGAPSLLFGILAMRWGDGFWDWVREHLRWFG